MGKERLHERLGGDLKTEKEKEAKMEAIEVAIKGERSKGAKEEKRRK